LELEGISALGDKELLALKDISLTLHAGEILGIAGVAGNGQIELAEVIVGDRSITKGQINVKGQNVADLPIGEGVRSEISYVPEETVRQGLLPSMTLAESVILKNHMSPPYSSGIFLNEQAIQSRTEKLIKDFDVRCPGPQAPVKLLSGGNQQRLLLSRELSQGASIIVASQPTKGLDVAAIDTVHRLLVEERSRGRGVLLISTELDEILRLSDRIAVLYEGEIRGIVDGQGANPNEIGMLMGGSQIDSKPIRSFGVTE
jgi:simple sugar transport system ATP-binding protein